VRVRGEKNKRERAAGESDGYLIKRRTEPLLQGVRRDKGKELRKLWGTHLDN